MKYYIITDHGPLLRGYQFLVKELVVRNFFLEETAANLIVVGHTDKEAHPIGVIEQKLSC